VEENDLCWPGLDTQLGRCTRVIVCKRQGFTKVMASIDILLELAFLRAIRSAASSTAGFDEFSVVAIIYVGH